MIRRIIEAIDEVELEPAAGMAKKIPPVEAMRQAILEVLGSWIAAHVGAYPSVNSDEWDREEVKAVITKSTRAGDPHQWCGGNNIVTVYHESGVPSQLDHEYGIDYKSLWVKVNERASELSGRKLISEPYNSAVTCVYEEK